MKSNLSLIIFTLLLIMISCSKEETNNMPENPAEVANTITTGTWKISYFWDTDHEETQHFNGYSFTFENSGTLVATNGMTNITGSWSTGTDDSQIKLNIIFTSPADFEELSDDWHVLERTENKIRLEDVSGGNGGTDYLTFERL